MQRNLRLKNHSIIFLVVGILAASCVGSYVDATATPAPVEATVSLTLTSPPTASPSPTSTATETQTATPTPSIMEVTPLGGQPTPLPKDEHVKIERISGWYTPYSTRNVRWGPSIDKPIRYRLAAGNAQRVYAWASDLPVEMWVCLDEPIGNDYLCHEAVAAVWDWVETGEFIIDE